MTRDMNVNKADQFQRKKNKQEMKMQVISFGLMIIFTLVAFAAVSVGSIQKMFMIPILLIMALVQVAFQFYYFMHMKEDGHEMPAALIYGGVWCALLTLGGLGIIAWW